jgi:hypothetical protein
MERPINLQKTGWLCEFESVISHLQFANKSSLHRWIHSIGLHREKLGGGYHGFVQFSFTWHFAAPTYFLVQFGWRQAEK